MVDQVLGVVTMSELKERSVWVSDLNPPIASQDIVKYFSRAGDVDQVIVPDVSGSQVLVVFQNAEAIVEALKYSGKSFRDATIVISQPTNEQMLLCEPKSKDIEATSPKISDIRKSLQGMSDSDIKAMMEELTSIATKRLSTLSTNDERSHSPDRMNDSRENIQLNPSRHSPPRILASPSMFFPPMQYPRIVLFSGDAGKSDHASYHQWRNEVRCLLTEGHPPTHLLQAIRRSLKGTAAEVLLNLGENATPQNILDKFDVIFGTALSSEALIEDFYTARQKGSEPVVVWGCRLESLLTQARDKGIISGNTEEMLRTKFWSGIHNIGVKNAIRHRFDAGESFQQLLIAARAVEYEALQNVAVQSSTPVSSTKSSGKVNVQSSSTPDDTKFEKLLKKMEEMTERLKKLETKQTDVNRGASSRSRSSANRPTSGIECFYCRQKGHFIRDCVKLQKKNQENTQ